MIKLIATTARDRDRVGEIAAVAARFGLGVLLARLGFAGEGADADAGALPLPRRTRLALEALGPSFVKIGQILATRGDLLPPEWIAELEQLHSDAPTLDFETIRAAVEEALGEPPEAAFARFDPVPLAAASMAQVHRARLKDGREVVLKVRRPGIRRAMEADMRLIAELAALVERSSAEARRFEPVALARQLRQAMLEELDFTQEGRNADRIRQDLAGQPGALVPGIHWQWTSETLLVMDYVEGVKPLSAEALAARGIDPAAIAELGADLVIEMVLVHGRFHGDPHPGNLLCLPGNRLALLDLGSIGHVGPGRREEFLGFVTSLAWGNPRALAETLALWSEGHGVPRGRIDRAAEQIVQRHGGGRIVMAEMVPDFLRLLREEGLVMPPDLLLVFKAFVTMDGVLARIAPGFDLSGAIRRAAARLVAARFAPGRLAASGGMLAWTLAGLGDDAPRLLRAAIRRIEAEPPNDAATAAAIRRGAGWIAAALLGGAAILAVALVLA
ncbi:ubiquinone biosynthesis protein [Sphingomonas sp. IBVSS2]|uniref:ABC1 kinase family protein n=1 Tax=Sphingomonas sp. IBVSS2 TaxID=1985172 RepID=UPI000A2D8121|nr:AarF/UbiB family protein [Sphingomonas sp. IBVSS2]OSZ69433.1 ubiquinone biosynthesis protein [Sphingomonas sp. IBVSS2]